MTSVPAVGAPATQSHATDGAAAVGVAVPVNTPAVSASPFGGWWPMSAPFGSVIYYMRMWFW
ncbi:hypothetical protein BDA96_06G077700 [Sorghum bicolor]|jgi:hypothetical protein|uniref:Uncharacterized protein n=1 Tax=Sorghum bicolor TaxID=4558 RepID=A0A921QRP9_SORBI|nr:hypothetical protein BDA96_06G077700 [Sorghum bicolor]